MKKIIDPIKLLSLIAVLMATGVGIFSSIPIAKAATTAGSQLTQTINAGTLSTDIRNSSGAVVSNPTFAMSVRTVSTSQQTSTGTFGSSTQRITVDNPGGANNGWTLALAATNANNKWTSGSDTYDYKGTAAQGQLTVNANAGTITATVGGATGVTKGASAAYSGANTSILIMQANASAAKIWNGYITGVTLSQTIPAAQASGNYSLDMTQTVTAT